MPDGCSTPWSWGSPASLQRRSLFHKLVPTVAGMNAIAGSVSKRGRATSASPPFQLSGSFAGSRARSRHHPWLACHSCKHRACLAHTQGFMVRAGYRGYQSFPISARNSRGQWSPDTTAKTQSRHTIFRGSAKVCNTRSCGNSPALKHAGIWILVC